MVGTANILTTGQRSAARDTPVKDNVKCILICIVATFGVWQYNMDTTLLNGFQAMPCFLAVFGYRNPALPGGYGIDTVFQQLITSLLQLGLIPSSLLIGPMSKYIGRRWGYVVATFFSVIGITVQMLVTSSGPVYVARLLIGFGNGIFVNVSVLYISECAPAHLRGSIVACFQVTQNLGGIVGAIINNFTAPLGGKQCYQIPIGILYIVPVLLSIAMIFMPESPRWLMKQGRPEEASKSLHRLRGNSLPEELVQEELEEIQATIALEKELAESGEWMDMFRGSDLRRTLTAMGATLCHSASGINFLVGYATYFFQISGIPTSDAFKYSIILQVVATVSAFIGTFLNRYFGRRSLLISGAAICAFCMFVIAITYTANGGSGTGAPGKAMVAFVNIYLASYSYSIGPIAWVVAGEVPSGRLRSQTLGLAMAVQFLFAWLCTFTLPYFFNPQNLGLGPKIGFIWGPINLIMLVWLIFFLPDCKGLSLESVDELFAANVPAWRFQKYKLKGLENTEEIQEKLHHHVQGEKHETAATTTERQ